MKASLQTSSTETTLPFEIETIEQWIEENFYPTNILSCNTNEYKIIWLKKGSGFYNNGNFEDAAESGFVFCLHFSQRNSLCITPGAEGYIISFTDNFLRMDELEFDLGCQAILLQMFSTAAGVFVHNELQHDLNEIISRIIKEYINIFIFKTEILRRYLKIFLIYLTRQFDESFRLITQTRNNELIQKFLAAVEKNYRDKKMVIDYAEMLFVTPNYLNEVVKKNTGFPAGYHIRRRVALEAKRMVLHSNNSMKEIAYDLGFLDCAHFSKFFKTITGSNFSDFKKEKLTVAIAVL